MIEFDCDKSLTWYDYPNSPWGENREWAYDLVKNRRPKKIVELGSYLGCSTFAFAQACKDNHIPCEIYAIDSWAGDENSGFYDERIYEEFSRAFQENYKFEKLFMMRLMFDQAVEHFPKKDIDILHIDGLHTYEAVKHDFNTWKPKVRKGGIILMHDINVEGFGVKDFWKEVKNRCKTEEFLNKNGLGVVYV